MASNYQSWEVLYGKTLREVSDSVDTLLLTFTDGTKLEFYHAQDCCENVFITGYIFSNSFVEGFKPYYNQKLISITESEVSGDTTYGSYTKTTFTLKFEYGKEFEVHWFGESNGYYSEGVSYKIHQEVDGKEE